MYEAYRLRAYDGKRIHPLRLKKPIKCKCTVGLPGRRNQEFGISIYKGIRQLYSNQNNYTTDRNMRPAIAVGGTTCDGVTQSGVATELNTRPVTMSISSFFSSLVAGTLHADAEEVSKVSEVEPQQEEVAGEAEAAQEEEEPEDVRFDFALSEVFFAERGCARRSIPSCVKRRKSRPSARLPPSTSSTAKKTFSPERVSSMKIVWKKCEFFLSNIDTYTCY
jgi:hypothetical protein